MLWAEKRGIVQYLNLRDISYQSQGPISWRTLSSILVSCTSKSPINQILGRVECLKRSSNKPLLLLTDETLVPVGLCAFRAGLVYEAQTAPQEFCGSGCQRELLAQGVMIQRYSQASAEQERLQQQRQLPFHVDINLE